MFFDRTAADCETKQSTVGCETKQSMSMSTVSFHCDDALAKLSTASPAHHYPSKNQIFCHFSTKRLHETTLLVDNCRSRPGSSFDSVFGRHEHFAPSPICQAAGHRKSLSSHLRSFCPAMYGQRVASADGLCIGPAPNRCHQISH